MFGKNKKKLFKILKTFECLGSLENVKSINNSTLDMESAKKHFRIKPFCQIIIRTGNWDFLLRIK